MTARVALVASLVGSTLALLWPALHNGYPLLRFDSAGYVTNALQLHFFEWRPIGYPLFLRGVLASETLWPALLVQSLGTCLLALRLARVLHPHPLYGLAAGVTALGVALVLTPLAAHTSTLMPDAFTSWLFLGGALCLVAAHRGDVLLGAGACFASLLVHSTHLPVAVAGLLVCFAARAVGPLSGRVPRARLGALALAVALSLATTGALARHFPHGGAPVGGHPAFLVARLHALGLLVPSLDRYCPQQQGWRLCAFRDALARSPTDEASWFLWDPASPFGAIGRFDAAPELREIAGAGLGSFLPHIAGATLRGAWLQLWQVETRTGLERRPAQGYALALETMLPDESRRAAAADQASGRPLAVVFFPSLEGALHAALWLAALLVAARCWQRGAHTSAWLIAAALGFLAIHALVVGFGTSPLGRYQGRVAWLVAFVLVLGAGVERASGAVTSPLAQSR